MGMGDYSLGNLSRDALHGSGDKCRVKREVGTTYIPEDLAEDDRLVELMVVARSRNASRSQRSAFHSSDLDCWLPVSNSKITPIMPMDFMALGRKGFVGSSGLASIGAGL